jgi:hypothetical protein
MKKVLVAVMAAGLITGRVFGQGGIKADRIVFGDDTEMSTAASGGGESLWVRGTNESSLGYSELPGEWWITTNSMGFFSGGLTTPVFQWDSANPLAGFSTLSYLTISDALAISRTNSMTYLTIPGATGPAVCFVDDINLKFAGNITVGSGASYDAPENITLENANALPGVIRWGNTWRMYMDTTSSNLLTQANLGDWSMPDWVTVQENLPDGGSVINGDVMFYGSEAGLGSVVNGDFRSCRVMGVGSEPMPGDTAYTVAITDQGAIRRNGTGAFFADGASIPGYFGDDGGIYGAGLIGFGTPWGMNPAPWGRDPAPITDINMGGYISAGGAIQYTHDAAAYAPITHVRMISQGRTALPLPVVQFGPDQNFSNPLSNDFDAGTVRIAAGAFETSAAVTIHNFTDGAPALRIHENGIDMRAGAIVKMGAWRLALEGENLAVQYSEDDFQTYTNVTEFVKP